MLLFHQLLAELKLKRANLTMNEDQPMSTPGYDVAAISLSLIAFFGFTLNLLVIVLMYREKQLWTPFNVILFNLVVSDFCVSIFGTPLTLASALAQRWLFGRVMCTAYGFFMSILGISSITTLTVLSFERYLMISRPFKNHKLSHRDAALLLLGIWAYSACLTVPPLLGWGEYVNESANISCSVNWETRSKNATSFIMYLFTFGFFIPIIVIGFSFWNIMQTIKKNVQVNGSVAKAENKVAVMVAVMIFAFFFAWTPYAILALLIAFADAHVAPWLSVIPALVAKSSICYNPIIYVGLNKQYRSAWKRLLGIEDPMETARDNVGMGTMGTQNTSRSTTEETLTPDVIEADVSVSVVEGLDADIQMAKTLNRQREDHEQDTTIALVHL